MENNNSQIENALIDVRKAYRLLYVYQRRVMDIMQFIADITSRRYEGGWSKFSNSSPKDSKGYLTQWSWDWLNMYCYEFFFGDKIINENSIGLSVWLVSDTGFYDVDANDKLNLDSFSNVESSSTKLVFVIGRNTWHSDFNDFEVNMKSEATEYVRHDEKGILLVKSFKLSTFLNADETRKRLQELVLFCQGNGISEMSIIN